MTRSRASTTPGSNCVPELRISSGDVHIKPELAGKVEGWRRVAFVLTAGGKTGEFQLDDIYVDPRMSR
jgi:hypothetical protein